MATCICDRETRKMRSAAQSQFPIEISRPRVPGIASNFLRLTFKISHVISTNSRKQISRFRVELEIALQDFSGAFRLSCNVR